MRRFDFEFATPAEAARSWRARSEGPAYRWPRLVPAIKVSGVRGPDPLPHLISNGAFANVTPVDCLRARHGQ